MTTPTDPQRETNIAQLTEAADEIVRFLRDLTSTPGPGAAGLGTLTRLESVLSERYRAVVDGGGPPLELDAGKSLAHAIATAPSMVRAMIEALPRLTVGAPAHLADVDAAARDGWLEHVQETSTQDSSAALATLTSPGRTLTALTMSTSQHAEKKILDQLRATYRADLLSASTLTIIGTGAMCPSCCVDLFELLNAHPRMDATIRTWAEPESVASALAGPEDEYPADPVVIVLTSDVDPGAVDPVWSAGSAADAVTPAVPAPAPDPVAVPAPRDEVREIEPVPDVAVTAATMVETSARTETVMSDVTRAATQTSQTGSEPGGDLDDLDYDDLDYDGLAELFEEPDDEEDFDPDVLHTALRRLDADTAADPTLRTAIQDLIGSDRPVTEPAIGPDPSPAPDPGPDEDDEDLEYDDVTGLFETDEEEFDPEVLQAALRGLDGGADPTLATALQTLIGADEPATEPGRGVAGPSPEPYVVPSPLVARGWEVEPAPAIEVAAERPEPPVGRSWAVDPAPGLADVAAVRPEPVETWPMPRLTPPVDEPRPTYAVVEAAAPVTTSDSVSAPPEAEPRDLTLARLIHGVRKLVRFLPDFTAVADRNEADDSNFRLQRLAARVDERYAAVATAGVEPATLPDDVVERLPVEHGLEAVDGRTAEWEGALTRAFLRGTRLSIGARADMVESMVTGRQLIRATARFKVAEPVGPDIASGNLVAREWLALLQEAGDQQPAALVTLTLESGENLTAMTTGGEGSLVQAYIAGTRSTDKGRLPRYSAYPVGGDVMSRHVDAEKKIFDYLATNHEADLDKLRGAYLTMVTTEAMCPSCGFVSLQFLADFETVGVTTRMWYQARPHPRGIRSW